MRRLSGRFSAIYIDQTHIFLGVTVLAILFLVAWFTPVRTVRATVTGKRWQTWMHLKEDYQVYTCDGNDCDWEDRTRTLESATLTGSGLDPVVYPPAFPLRGRDTYNQTSGEFTVIFLIDDGRSREHGVRQSRYEANYYQGLECNVKLNIFTAAIRDDCVAKGR